MTDRELMEQTLEVLENHAPIVGKTAIIALRERLAQPEQSIYCAQCEALAKELVELYSDRPKRQPPQFPNMLRKMWSGAEVQEWINEHWSKT